MNVGRREAAGLAVLAAVVAASLLTDPRAALAGLAGLADRPVAFAALLVAVWAVRPFLGWPTVAVSTAVGYVLGPVAGFPVAMVGVLATSVPPFFAAGWFAGGDPGFAGVDAEPADAGSGSGDADPSSPDPGARRTPSGDGALSALGERGRAYFRTVGGVRGVAAARLAPVPADAVSCAAGLAGVRPRAYAAGTLVGELPWTAAAVVVGGSARRLATADPGEVGLPLLVGTTLAAAVLLAGPATRALGDRVGS